MALKIPVELVVQRFEECGDLVHAHGEDGTTTYWVPWVRASHPDAAMRTVPVDPADPDTWEAPVPLSSPRFRRMIHDHFPSISPTKSRCRDYVEAVEAAAYSGRRLREEGWSSRSGSGGNLALRIAISPAVVVVITPHTLQVERNGANGIHSIPPDFSPLSWSRIVAAARPGASAMRAARDAVIDHMPAPVPSSALSQDEQAATVLAWFVGLLAEPVCRGRPMLVMLGEPGSGKTLTAQLLGVLYYGERFEVGGGVGGSRAVKDLTASMVRKPLAVADDLTNVKREAVDTLCRLATGSAVELATLHETMHLSTFKAKAAAILTSARPEWALRDDLLSRILPVRYDKAGHSPLTSQDRIDRALRNRDAVWADLLTATQHAVSQVYAHGYRPERCFTRFEDWETLVRAVAVQGGWHDTLVGALTRMDAQRVSVATSSSLEVGALYAIAKEYEHNPRHWTVADLYDLVIGKMGAMIASEQQYRPSARMRVQDFAKFLRRVETEGSAAVSLHSAGEANGHQMWTLRPKG